MSKEPLQHFPAEHISQCVNKAVESTGNPGKNIKFPGSECTHSFHQACLRWQWQKLQKPWPRAGSRARFPCHSQDEVLPSFVSAVSGWPSVLLPLSEAAEYLSDTSTCQQAPGTSSTDAGDPFFQPARAARTFFPFSRMMRSHSLCSRCFHPDIPSQLTHTVPFPLFLNTPHPSWAHL